MNVMKGTPKLKFILAVCLVSTPAFAGPKLVVDDDGAQCRDAQYNSIQAAVMAAPRGSEIVVCAGTYTEQVKIPPGKDNLTLRSEKPLAAIIKGPGSLVDQSVVEIAGSQNVTIRGFTIAGPDALFSGTNGVAVDGGGSGVIRENHITVDRGIAVLVGNFQGPDTGTATIQRNIIDRYRGGGIAVISAGSSADIRENDVTGAPPTFGHGIDVSGGASANIENNRVSQNTSLDYPIHTGALGIAVFGTGNEIVKITHNEVFSNDRNIVVYGEAKGVVVQHNNVSGGHDGIFVVQARGADVSHNTS